MKALRFMAVAALVGLAGCASLLGGDPDAGLSTEARGCLQFFSVLDRRVGVAGVRDGAAHRLPGFPYLRSDRFTASFASRFAGDQVGRADGEAVDKRAFVRGREIADVAFDTWLGRMIQLDRQARAYEIDNLPAGSFPVAGYADGPTVRAQVSHCGRVLVSEHGSDPRRRVDLVRASEVPDEYSGLLRLAGLYPITGIGIASGIRRWESQSREAFARQRLASDTDQVVYQRYVPGEPGREGEVADQASRLPLTDPTPLAIEGARAVLRQAPVDALGVPLLDPAATEQLARAYAPTFEIATSAEHDRFGPLQWIDLEGLVGPKADRYWLDVDSSQPVVYFQLAYARYGSAVLPQIVYTIWFPERMATERTDLEAGRIDGLIWRVTLDPFGVPLLYDSVHPSGCCHQFFHTRRLMPRSAPADRQIGEWAFSPIGVPVEQWLADRGRPVVDGGRQAEGRAGSPTVPPASASSSDPAAVDPGAALDPAAADDPAAEVGPLALHVATHSHQLVGVGWPNAPWSEPQALNPPYRLVPADELRTLARPGSTPRSVYDPDGRIIGSERVMRFVLWPAGISNAGAQRQYGRLATAFVGRRHFDDPDLLEARYRLRPN